MDDNVYASRSYVYKWEMCMRTCAHRVQFVGPSSVHNFRVRTGPRCFFQHVRPEVGITPEGMRRVHGQTATMVVEACTIYLRMKLTFKVAPVATI